MNKKELEQVYYLKKELTMWQKRLQELQYDIAISPQVPDGMPFQHTNNSANPTYEKAVRLAQTAQTIEEKISEIQSAVYEIENFIVKVEDPLMRQIIEYRCVECRSWEEIGSILNYSRTSISRRYERFVNEHFAHNAHS